jgi:hypothetical protein
MTSGDLDPGLTPLPPRRLTGREPVAAGRAQVIDFWRWAFSDLRDNTLRGALAEWIVGLALGCVDGVRPAWDNHDLLYEGIPVEVKSAAYLQSWPTKRHSRITFGRLSGRAWDEEAGKRGPAPTFHADVYVFAVQTAREHAGFDPLDVSQWAFWVAPRAAVEELGFRSLSLATVQRICDDPLGFDDLAAAVERAAGRPAPGR